MLLQFAIDFYQLDGKMDANMIITHISSSKYWVGSDFNGLRGWHEAAKFMMAWDEIANKVAI